MNEQNEIKAVVFDFGKVFYNYDRWPKFEWLGQQIGVKKEEIYEKSRELIWLMMKGKLNEKEFWEELGKRLGKKLPEGWSKKFWLIGLDEFGWNEKMKKLAVELKQKGYKIAILTNTVCVLFEEFKKRGFYDFAPFDAIVASCEIGFVKPEKEAYLYVIDKLGVKPEEAVFIDDKPKNVEGAKEVGMHSILFVNEEQAIEEIRKIVGL